MTYPNYEHKIKMKRKKKSNQKKVLTCQCEVLYL